MTKDKMAKLVWNKLEVDSKGAKTAVETVFKILKQAMQAGENIEIRGFGKFVIRDKNARIGRNPRTGEETEITARKVVTFKASRVLKNELCE